MKKVKQLSLFLSNKPGVLSKVCSVLAKKKINILGICVTDGHDHAVVRMVVSNAGGALHSLEQAGILVIENDVLMLRLPNRAGALGAISRVLARKKINIEYSYCTVADGEATANLILGLSDIRVGETTLRSLLKNR